MRIRILAVESLNPDILAVGEWGRPGYFADRTPFVTGRWVAHGIPEDKPRLRVTIPLKDSDALMLRTNLFNAGEPIFYDFSGDIISLTID